MQRAIRKGMGERDGGDQDGYVRITLDRRRFPIFWMNELRRLFYGYLYTRGLSFKEWFFNVGRACVRKGILRRTRGRRRIGHRTKRARANQRKGRVLHHLCVPGQKPKSNEGEIEG